MKRPVAETASGIFQFCFILLTCWGLAIDASAGGISPRHSVRALGEPPTAPPQLPQPDVMLAAQSVFGTNWINTSSREQSRQFFARVYSASEGVPMDWSGSYATGNAGTNSDAYLEAVLRRVNYFRAMAGVNSVAGFNPEYSQGAQEAAMMMAANDTLSHHPPTNWLFYTEAGAQAAGKSNLSIGEAGPEAIDDQMHEYGSGNAAVGHRRWILYPQTQLMGSGSVPNVITRSAASALWVMDNHYGAPRPPTRDGFVSWPPPGYVPYPVVYARWSFSYPRATFSSNSVKMWSNGVPMTVRTEPIANGYGENTIVWVPGSWDTDSYHSIPRPAADTLYTVQVENVVINGTSQTFNYEVRVFDPDVAGTEWSPPVVSGPDQAGVGANQTYTCTAVPGASGYEWRRSTLVALTFNDGAENGLTNWIVRATTDAYNVRASLSYTGSYSFHLAHTQTVNQVLTLKRSLVAAANSSIRFQSRLGYATSNQVAKVQISLDDGVYWTTVYRLAGNGEQRETNWNLRTINLAPYAGKTLRVRLNYEYNPGFYYPQASSGVGWYVDNFELLNCQEMRNAVTQETGSEQTFAFTPLNTVQYRLEARPLLFGDYGGEWGTGLKVLGVAGVQIMWVTKASANTWHIFFNLLGGSPSGYELYGAGTPAGPFAKETGAVIQTLTAGQYQYRAVVTTNASQRFFIIRAL